MAELSTRQRSHCTTIVSICPVAKDTRESCATVNKSCQTMQQPPLALWYWACRPAIVRPRSMNLQDPAQSGLHENAQLGSPQIQHYINHGILLVTSTLHAAKSATSGCRRVLDCKQPTSDTPSLPASSVWPTSLVCRSLHIVAPPFLQRTHVLRPSLFAKSQRIGGDRIGT